MPASASTREITARKRAAAKEYQKKGLTTTEIARVLQVSRQNVYNWLRDPATKEKRRQDTQARARIKAKQKNKSTKEILLEIMHAIP